MREIPGQLSFVTPAVRDESQSPQAEASAMHPMSAPAEALAVDLASTTPLNIATESELADGPFVKAIEVRRSDRRKRTVAAKLEKDTLIVYLPARMSRAEEIDWIDKMRERFEARERREKLNSTGDLDRRARSLNRRYFDGKLEWRSITYVTNQNSRYGSCTFGDATIRLADCLAGMPGWVKDYVVVHELAHLIAPDHSERFWKLVNRYPLTERARGFLIAKGLES
ncbi:MAG: M48 family metallopeptidase [Actinobacteria bacterium]|nr:M48 family metallopeptidase [Actinomycetota bacterium]